MGFLGNILGGIATSVVGGFLGNALTPRGTNAPTSAEQLQSWELEALRQRFPQMIAARDRAYQNLSPSGARGIAQGIASRRVRAGAETGRSNAQTLGRQGYGSGVQAGAQLQGRNQGNTAGNDALMALLSPSAQAQNAINQANLYSPGSLTGGGAQAVANQQNQQIRQQSINANAPANGLESAFSILSLLGPYLQGNNPTSQPVRPISSSNTPTLNFGSMGFSDTNWQNPAQYRWTY